MLIDCRKKYGFDIQDLDLFDESILKNTENKYSFRDRSFMNYFIAEKILEILQEPNNATFFDLSPALIAKNTEVLAFLHNALDINPKLKMKLLGLISKSRASKSSCSSAITLLNGIGYGFQSMNLSKIRIPGAILTNGRFDHAVFHDADLSQVKFNNASLSYASFDQANIEEIQFGELPVCNTFPDERPCIGFSEDGSLFGVCIQKK